MPQQQTSSPGQGQRFDWWAAPAATSAPTTSDRPDPVTRSASTRTDHAVPTQPAPAAAPATTTDSTEVYRTIQCSGAFQDIRRSYRSFVFPVSSASLAWYLAYVAAQAAAPDLMRTPVAGPFNVAWLLGLLQFASTFLLTWLYARNARTKRDRAALGLRWDTQDQLR